MTSENSRGPEIIRVISLSDEISIVSDYCHLEFKLICDSPTMLLLIYFIGLNSSATKISGEEF